MTTAITTTAGATVGRIEVGDTLSITFSEPLAPATVPGVATVTEADPAGAGFDTLNITGLTNGNLSTGSDTYITVDGTNAAFASSTIALTNNNTTATVTVGGTCQGTACVALGLNLTATSFGFTAAPTLTDPAANIAAGTLSATLRLF